MPGSVVDIRNSYGAAFVGLLALGLTIAQTWIYFWYYHDRDSKALKLFISFITFMDALLTILSGYVMYWYLIVNFDNVENLSTSTWALNLQIIISIISGTSVEFYYARRVYKVSQSITCPILIVALVTISSSCGLFFTLEGAALKRFTNSHALTWVSVSGMIAGVLAELLLASAMCWSLYRKKTGFARSDSIITTLMAYTINSGLLTCVLGAAMAISSLVSPYSLIWLSFFWALGKCQVNSLLAMLNSRDYVRDRPMTNPDTPYNLSSLRIEPMSETYMSKAGQPGVSVMVHRSTTSDFGRNKSDHDGETTSTLAIRKPPSITPFPSQSQTSESSV
ncbi:hypothetical protein EI94DRAFT_1826692 [Lactarius quietus]|nr:hypothetical protein EI94DRAFT_1826692 [Lactarius quietus]